MKNWQIDLLSVIDGTPNEHECFEKISGAANLLGFEHCAYGMQIPLSLSNPKVILFNTYPVAWQTRYMEAGYLHTDPTVLHGRRTRSPVIWTDDVFASSTELWDEAQSFGLRVGWAQSSLDANGVVGMLSLSRSHDVLSKSELARNELEMTWLVNVTHLTLLSLMTPKLQVDIHLTHREVEVLKWTADGKTSEEISTILSISINTVNFHIKNAVAKLETKNKTAAVVRAAMLGLLN